MMSIYKTDFLLNNKEKYCSRRFLQHSQLKRDDIPKLRSRQAIAISLNQQRAPLGLAARLEKLATCGAARRPEIDYLDVQPRTEVFRSSSSGSCERACALSTYPVLYIRRCISAIERGSRAIII